MNTILFIGGQTLLRLNFDQMSVECVCVLLSIFIKNSQIPLILKQL